MFSRVLFTSSLRATLSTTQQLFWNRSANCTVSVTCASLSSQAHYLSTDQQSLHHRHRFSTMVKNEHVEVCIENDEIVKSARDQRQYRAMQLTNGMKVMLISDPDTDKSSAAIDVNVGYMTDPKDIPGLAHFCEHMLFLGTEKYPEENGYQKFLSEHGGSSNAFTSSENTNFYFDVRPDSLSDALDRFAQFFLSPLFTACATEREVNAVNSENEKNIQSDPWRLYQLERSTSDPNHDYSKFGTGNKYTLETKTKEMGLDVRDELLKFHSAHYSANLMALTVLGKETLDELTDMVLPLFSGVNNKNLAVPEWQTPPYGPEQLQVKASVVPVKDIRSMNINWPIPDLQPHYKSNPGHYLGHLIGHEGPGSLLSELKTRGWVNTLVGGQKNGAKGFMLFMVFVDLTEEGLKHVDDIVTLVFQYINMLKKEGPQEWVFKECQDLSSMTFRFKDKEKPRSYTSSMSGLLCDFPLKEALCGPYLLHEFRPDLINMVLEKLVPDTTRIAVVAKSFEGQTDLKEPWYGTEYKLEKIPEDILQKWRNCGLHENLKLPPKNEFIPTNFDLLTREPSEGNLPEIIKDDCMSRLWFKQDDKFLRPKACLNFEFTSPYAYLDPIHTNLTYMFVELVKDALSEYAYAAELAGLHYSLNSTTYGLSLQVMGYNDKQHVLLKKLIEKLTTFEVDPKRFEILKEMYARGLRNFHAEQPHQHAVYYTTILMSELKWTNQELQDALDELTFDRLKSFIPELLSKLFVESLVYGNVTKQHSLEMLAIVEDVLKKTVNVRPLAPSQYKRYREIQLPDGCYYVYKKTNLIHSSSCIEIYYQCGVQETNSNVLLELFSQVISEPCFTVLRTQEQLGYIVFSGIRRHSGVQGLRVIVQSDRQPEYVESRVEAFLHSMENHLKEMDEEGFKKHVQALASKRLELPKKLGEQNGRFWAEILSQQYNFDRDDVEVSHLKTLTKEDLYKFYKENVSHDAPHRHKLSIHVLSTAPQGEGEVTPPNQSCTDGLLPVPSLCEPAIITDEVAFKRGLGLYPLAKPYIDIKAKSKL